SELRDKQLNVSAAIFKIEDRNRAIADPVVPARFVAAGEVENKGWEAEVAGKLTSSWDLYGGYTFLLTKVVSQPTGVGTTFSPAEPRHNLKLWTNYRLGGEWSRFSIGGGLLSQSSYNNGAAVLVKQGGYSVASAQVGYRIDKNLTASFTVNNLF